MKIFVLSLLLSITLWGCMSENNIILDQDTTYKIPEGYKVVAKTQSDVDVYKSFFGKKDNNSMVLYKLLSDTNVLIFIGIGYETSYEKIKNEILLQNENKVILQDYDQNKSFTICVNRDSLNTVTHHLRILDSGNIYLFTILSKDIIKDTAFIEKYIENQIITK
jgi:hypothetical protein